MPLWWVRSRAACAGHVRVPRAVSWSTQPRLWFADFHAYHARVHAKTITGRSSWCRISSGPWRLTHSADGMTAAHAVPTSCFARVGVPSQNCVLFSSPVPSLALRVASNDQCDGSQCCPSFGEGLRRHHQKRSLRLHLTQHGKPHQVLTQ